MKNRLDGKEVQAWVEEFLKSPQRRYVFGCNEWGADMHHVFGLAGFIDDVVGELEYCGVPVLRTNEIPHNAMVVSTVVGERPLTALNKLAEVGANALDYFAFYKAQSSKLVGIEYWDGVKPDLSENSIRYQRLKGCLSDEESRRSLDSILQFRETYELQHMSGFSDRQKDQYFESFLAFDPHSVFYDVGAFGGETSVQFAKKAGRYKEIHLFEPIASTFERARMNLSSCPNVHFHQFGLGAEFGEFSFEVNGSSSRISSIGTEHCVIRSLDSIRLTPPTFIKVDIEGAEMDFLAGATGTLQRDKPALAIACYHNPEHIWEIFDFVTNILPKHDVYLRHYTEGFAETDLFFVPAR
jgi:FkbM family methyltransferase